jgi:hypothetical protein
MPKKLVMVDDILQIFIIPYYHKTRKYLTYDELDDMRRRLSPRMPSMLYEYNEMCRWVRRMKLRKMVRDIDE